MGSFLESVFPLWGLGLSRVGPLRRECYPSSALRSWTLGTWEKTDAALMLSGEEAYLASILFPPNLSFVPQFDD